MSREIIESSIIAYPHVGSGHRIISHAMSHDLEENGIPIDTLEIDGLFVWLASLYHQRLTSNIDRALAYNITSNAQRENLRTFPLSLEMGFSLTDSEARTIITSQGHIAGAGLSLGHKVNRFSGDAGPRETTEDQNFTHLVWTNSAKQKSPKSILVKPPLLSNGANQVEKTNLRTYSSIWVKPSASGVDKKVLTPIIQKLGNKRPIQLVSKKQPAGVSVLRANEDVFYWSLRKNPSQRVICFPSEQLLHMAQLSQNAKSLKVIFLYPRGPHELENIKEAIHMGLTRTIIIPKTHQGIVSDQLSSIGVGKNEVRLVDPNDLKESDFEPAQSWKFPKNALPFARVIRDAITKD